MAIKPRWSSRPDEKLGFGGGLGNFPFEAEGLGFEVGFMMKRIKEIFLFL